MHDFCFEKLLADPANFKSREGNRYIEIVEQEASEKAEAARREGEPITFEEGQINENNIPAWLDKAHRGAKGDKYHALRLLIGAPEEHHSDAEMLPLPIARPTYEAICRSWNLPSEFLRMMLSTLPLAVPFDTSDTNGTSLRGLMLRGGRSRDWNFCLALVHNSASGTTCGILNGMQQHEVEKVISCLRESREHIRDPRLLPVFLLELRVHFFAVLLEKRAVGIEEIEYSTGMRHGFSSDPRRNALIDKERKDEAKALDFDPITRKLTGVTGTLSFCDMTFSSGRRALDVVKGLRTEIGLGLGKGNITHSGGAAILALGRRIDYLDELLSGSRAHGAVLSARAKAQVQTVYSMIGQRDNRLNIETAAASREIAASSLAHNEAMKEIAEDSRNVAILTRRDSLDMRIIAAVTLVFLPGTFMATMFGSGLFNFFPETSTEIVSGWLWLYWALTVAVTAVVLFAWWLFARLQRRKLVDLEQGQEPS